MSATAVTSGYLTINNENVLGKITSNYEQILHSEYPTENSMEYITEYNDENSYDISIVQQFNESTSVDNSAYSDLESEEYCNGFNENYGSAIKPNYCDNVTDDSINGIYCDNDSLSIEQNQINPCVSSSNDVWNTRPPPVFTVT